MAEPVEDETLVAENSQRELNEMVVRLIAKIQALDEASRRVAIAPTIEAIRSRRLGPGYWGVFYETGHPFDEDDELPEILAEIIADSRAAIQAIDEIESIC